MICLSKIEPSHFRFNPEKAEHKVCLGDRLAWGCRLWVVYSSHSHADNVDETLRQIQTQVRLVRRRKSQNYAGDHRGNPRDQDVRVGSQFCQGHQQVAAPRYV